MVTGQTQPDVTVCRYNKYNMRMTPTMTGSENTVRRIDATEEGATTLAGGGSKKKEVVTVRHTTAAYL